MAEVVASFMTTLKVQINLMHSVSETIEFREKVVFSGSRNSILGLRFSAPESHFFATRYVEIHQS